MRCGVLFFGMMYGAAVCCVVWCSMVWDWAERVLGCQL
jgi:hypothetical protein